MIELSQSSHYLSGFSSNAKPTSISSSSYPEMENEPDSDNDKRETDSTGPLTFNTGNLSPFGFREQCSENNSFFDGVSSIESITRNN